MGLMASAGQQSEVTDSGGSSVKSLHHDIFNRAALVDAHWVVFKVHTIVNFDLKPFSMAAI